MFQTQSRSNLLKNPGNTASPAGGLFLLEDVSVTYGEVKALKNVHLSIAKGEVLFVTGASGAGKTTLLKLLAGDLEPTSGRIISPNLTGGRPVFVAQVFQNLRLIGNMNCEDNMMLAYDPSIYQSKSEFRSDMQELSRVLGIQDRMKLPARDANGGLRQKVALVRALLSRPDVIVADEPTSSLDYDNTRKIFDVLNLYNAKRGLTVVWASHNRELIKKFTGRIVHLDNGRLVHSGHACFI